MNLGKSAFRRYKVIDSLLRNSMRRYPTMEEIIEACKEKLDFEPSVETIQKDIANMRMSNPDGFDAPIRFNRSKMGYEYTDPNYSLAGISLKPEELDIISESVELIQSIGGARISEQFLHAIEKLRSSTTEYGNSKEKKNPILQTMVPPVSRGFEHFDLLYKACKEKIPVAMIYYSYKNRKFGHTIIHPFLIKEFDNRWYLIGFSEEHGAVRTFGLDRIFEPLLIKKKYTKSELSEVNRYLYDMYGVYPIHTSEKEDVSIKISRYVANNFQAYPIHSSQQMKEGRFFTFSLHFSIVPTLELARFLLAFGKNIEIVQPSWFKEFTDELV